MGAKPESMIGGITLEWSKPPQVFLPKLTWGRAPGAVKWGSLGENRKSTKIGEISNEFHDWI